MTKLTNLRRPLQGAQTRIEAPRGPLVEVPMTAVDRRRVRRRRAAGRGRGRDGDRGDEPAGRAETGAEAEGDAVVAVSWSGISTGTEKLLWTGRMPSFPGMGYPLVPGYESVGTVIETVAGSGLRVGQTVFVPGRQPWPHP
mgnify:CR=1 FL=1